MLEAWLLGAPYLFNLRCWVRARLIRQHINHWIMDIGQEHLTEELLESRLQVPPNPGPRGKAKIRLIHLSPEVHHLKPGNLRCHHLSLVWCTCSALFFLYVALHINVIMIFGFLKSCNADVLGDEMTGRSNATRRWAHSWFLSKLLLHAFCPGTGRWHSDNHGGSLNPGSSQSYTHLDRQTRDQRASSVLPSFYSQKKHPSSFRRLLGSTRSGAAIWCSVDLIYSLAVNEWEYVGSLRDTLSVLIFVLPFKVVIYQFM